EGLPIPILTREAFPPSELVGERLVVADLFVIAETDIVHRHLREVQPLGQQLPYRALAGPNGPDQDDVLALILGIFPGFRHAPILPHSAGAFSEGSVQRHLLYRPKD